MFTVILMLGISLYMQYPLLSRYSQTSSSSSQIKASLSAANGPSEIAEPFEEHVANLESQALTQEQRRKCLTEYQGDMHKDEFDILGDALADVSRRGKLTAAELSFLADDINKQKLKDAPALPRTYRSPKSQTSETTTYHSRTRSSSPGSANPTEIRWCRAYEQAAGEFAHAFHNAQPDTASN